MIYHVSPKGCDGNPGTLEAPFRTIGRAAALAMALLFIPFHPFQVIHGFQAVLIRRHAFIL